MTSWTFIEQIIRDAIKIGLLEDWREKLPWGKGEWRKRDNPIDVLGVCGHHSASSNQDPAKTNAYHIKPNHISKNGCPHICYTFGISHKHDCALLFNGLDDIVWSQGAPTKKGHPGDENRHLVSVLFFGDFSSPGHVGKCHEPTARQWAIWLGLSDWLRSLFKIKDGGWYGHRDFGKAHCPGSAIMLAMEKMRADARRLETITAWQEALLRWDTGCLPKYGADGDWGNESKQALVAFERDHKHKADGLRDPFTEQLLIEKYPDPDARADSWAGGVK
jgi:hypothetical protein